MIKVLHLVKKTIIVFNLKFGNKHLESVQAMDLCSNQKYICDTKLYGLRFIIIHNWKQCMVYNQGMLKKSLIKHFASSCRKNRK